jgi:hypothetical protein
MESHDRVVAEDAEVDEKISWVRPVAAGNRNWPLFLR